MNALLFFRKSLAAALVAAGTLVVVSPFALAQSPPDKHVHSPAADNSATDGDLTAQFRSLQKKVADLEAALQSQHASRYGTNSSGQSAAMPNMPTPDSADPALSNAKMGDKKMGMMKGMKGMGSMRQDAGGQPMSSGGMGMGMMGNEVGGMKGMSRGSGGMGMMSGMGGMPGGMGMGGQGMGMMKGMGMMGRNPAMKSSMNGMGSMGSMDMPS
ncbi:MAG TPA: hypothetical protein PLY87_25210, partial [Planctomycetaceae bacterium]|nr:hypothetical protein [Planctomycetaceae bacterium]